jgi:hypothetical protein
MGLRLHACAVRLSCASAPRYPRHFFWPTGSSAGKLGAMAARTLTKRAAASPVGSRTRRAASARKKTAWPRDDEATFAALRKVLARYEKRLVVVQDRPGSYSLNTRRIDPRSKKPMFFGSVAVKSTVVFHLMPVYIFPDLLSGISADLKKRMQGKSCFNFKTLDRQLLWEIGALTRAGFERFRSAELV